ncbi:MAG: PilZ domain-containing protein [Desulfobaccales bacterium]
MRVIPLTVQSVKRRVPRRAQRYQVRWAVKEINGKPVQDAWVVDVSCLGARLETTFALSPGLPVKFTVSLPDSGQELILNGRVVWMRPAFPSIGRFVQGLQFYGANWELERLARKGNPLGE